MRTQILRLSALALLLGVTGVLACSADPNGGGCGGAGGQGGGSPSACGSGTKWDGTKKQCVPAK